MGMLSREQRSLLERAQQEYSRNLTRAEEYLAGRRIDLEAASSVGLGVVVDPIPGHEFLVGRLAIPYMTPAGPVNMTFRCMAKHDCKVAGHQKYMTWEGLEANLYNVLALEKANSSIAIAEGELDALSSSLAGIPCVGISGAEKWKPYWKNVFEDFSRIYVWQEGDEAGKRFAKEMSRKVGAIRLALPDREDVNSIWVKEGPDGLRARVRK
jgi:hypothetical protein